jgi:hypothetical protein
LIPKAIKEFLVAVSGAVAPPNVTTNSGYLSAKAASKLEASAYFVDPAPPPDSCKGITSVDSGTVFSINSINSLFAMFTPILLLGYPRQL